MEIKYAPQYQGTTNYIAVHNAGGIGADYFASSQYLTAEQVNTAHKERFNMLSSLGFYGGYNFYIDKDGKITQFRAIGEETMAQKNWNYGGVAISICLAGNFTTGVDDPTFLQISALKGLIKQLPKVSYSHIVPHRFLQPGTECFGNSLSNTWASELFDEEFKKELQVQISLYQQILHLMLLIRRLKPSLKGRAISCSELDVVG